MKVKIVQKGDFKKTKKFLEEAQTLNIIGILEQYGRAGVEALADATPKDTGLTSDSWGYEIEIKREKARVIWTNSNIHDGVPIALLIQYGHGTGSGGYVEGRDYINPAIQKIFDQFANEVWREVISL